MNIFVLDASPIRAAEMHCDKHVIKMILESAQMLSSAHHVLKSPWANELYKLAHENHPCTIWARKCHANYEWLYALFQRLSQIYTENTGKVHKSWETMGELLAVCPPHIPRKPRTPFVTCMPSQYKRRNAPIVSYQMFYCHEKARFAKFTYNKQPDWYVDNYVLPALRNGGIKPTGRLALNLNKMKESQCHD